MQQHMLAAEKKCDQDIAELHRVISNMQRRVDTLEDSRLEILRSMAQAADNDANRG